MIGVILTLAVGYWAAWCFIENETRRSRRMALRHRKELRA